MFHSLSNIRINYIHFLFIFLLWYIRSTFKFFFLAFYCAGSVMLHFLVEHLSTRYLSIQHQAILCQASLLQGLTEDSLLLNAIVAGGLNQSCSFLIRSLSFTCNLEYNLNSNSNLNWIPLQTCKYATNKIVIVISTNEYPEERDTDLLLLNRIYFWDYIIFAKCAVICLNLI